MKNISIFGTSSDAGKSTMTFVIARLLQKRGIDVGIFKAQNVSNNSQVADDGSEIAISVHFQASVIGMKSSYHLNPILLKSGAKNRASVIVKGRELEEKDIKSYYGSMETLKPIVRDAFAFLDRAHACVVAEGAGGCVELNLLEQDLSNTFIAETFNNKIILVADIEKGGVFASIYGTITLLKEQFKQNLIGVLINKFRGDKSLFDEGVRIIEEEFGLPVLGVLPYTPLNMGFEDSASLQNYIQKPHSKIKVGVVLFPHMSNFNDFEPLVLDDEVEVVFITGALEQYDCVILPGSKRVVEDLAWLKSLGLVDALKSYKGRIMGICGGYEMLFERLVDTAGIESDTGIYEGIGLIDGEIVFAADKVVKRSAFYYHDTLLEGYEIHYGQSQKYPEYFESATVFGSFLHGIFDNDTFREKIFSAIDTSYIGFHFENRRRSVLDAFIDTMEKEIDMQTIIDAIDTKKEEKDG